MTPRLPLILAVAVAALAGWSMVAGRRLAAEHERTQAELVALRAEVASLRQGLDATTSTANEANTFAYAALNQLGDLGARVAEVSIHHEFDRFRDGKLPHP